MNACDPRPITRAAHLPRQGVQGSLLLAAVSLVACGTTRPDDIPYTDNLSLVWGEMMAPYGLYPLFPVGSDSQPGDIVMLCERTLLATAELDDAQAAPTKAPVPREWVWVTSLDPAAVSDALNKRAASRMAYAAARTTSAPANAPIGPQAVQEPYKIGVPAGSLGFRSFPSVLSYSKTRGDLGAGVTAGIVAAGLGASRATSGYFILEVPGAEVVELVYSDKCWRASPCFAGIGKAPRYTGRAPGSFTP